MAARRTATVADVHDLAAGMPGAEHTEGPKSNTIYAVRKRSFVFFRNPHPDAVDPETGERYTDVIVFWVESETDKRALVEDPTTPFFTTPHFDGYPAVLVRASRLGELEPERARRDRRGGLAVPGAEATGGPVACRAPQLAGR